MATRKAQQVQEATSAAIATVIAADKDLASRVRAVVDRAITMAEYTLEWGSPADKMQLMRSVMPDMMKALRQVDGSTADQEQRDAYKRLQAAIASRPVPER